jgi:nitrate/nitrite-specific signal transduction histidine kinase
MSGETKKGKPLVVSYTPLVPPPIETPEEERKLREQVTGALPPQEPMMTAAQYQNLARFYAEQAESFKKLFEDSNLAKWIKLAGIGGAAALFAAVAEFFHLLWLAMRYFRGF